MVVVKRKPKKGERWRVVLEGVVIETDAIAGRFLLSQVNAPGGLLSTRAWISSRDSLVASVERVERKDPDDQPT